MRRAAAALLLAVSLAFPAAATTQVGSVEVTPHDPPVSGFTHGYVEWRFTLRNLSQTKAHRVRLSLPNQTMSSWGRGEYLAELRKETFVGPSSVAEVTLYQPPVALMGQGVEVRLDSGERETVPLSVNSVAGFAGYGGPYPGSGVFHILTGRSIDAATIPSPAPPTPAGPPSPYAPPIPPSPYHFDKWDRPTKDWPGEWLAYTGYDGVLLSRKEIADLDPATAEALLAFVEEGGVLAVLGGFTPPAGWPVTLEAGGTLQVAHGGFGMLAVSDRDDARELSAASWTFLRDAWARTSSALSSRHTRAEVDMAFPVAGRADLPVRGLFLLMLGFAVVIGPVNLLVLARLKRRILLLVTVPSLSLLTSLGVYAYTLLAEGLKKETRTEVITVLDEARHRATTIGLTGFYSSLTPGGGLAFSRETELAPTVDWENGSPLTLDWTDGQHLASGWMRARVPEAFHVRKSELRRERLAVESAPDGTVSVVNGLGVPIEQLVLADRAQGIHTAGKIEEGQRVTLARSAGARGLGAATTLRDLFTSDWSGIAPNLERWPARYVSPGTYLAVVARTPFLEDGLANPRTRQGRSVVYGIWGAP